MDKPLTWKEACKWASSFFYEQKTKDPQFEAELLLRRAGAITRAQLFSRWDESLADDTWLRYYNWVQERASHRPIQYIIGEQEFYGRSYYVDERVLIPRPETELLVEHTLTKLQSGMRVLDIGTGSGAIAISLLLEADRLGIDIEVVALDVSADALVVAQYNAEQLLEDRLLEKINWLQADVWPEDNQAWQKQKFDIVLSNPPYIAHEDAATMDQEVTQFEPHTALFAADRGLAIYNRIVSGLDYWLADGGWLGLELGHTQAMQILSLLNVKLVEMQGSAQAKVCDKIALYEIKDWELIRDYAGHERILFYKKSN